MRPAIAGLVLLASIAGCGRFGSPELTIHNRTTVPISVIDEGAPTGSRIVVDACSSARYDLRNAVWTRIDPPAGGEPDLKDAAVVSIQAMPPPDASFNGATWVVTDSKVSRIGPSDALPPCVGVPPTPAPPIE